MTGYEGDEGRARADEYEALSPGQLFKPVADLLPSAPASILDIGCGSGRDAAWLAGQGHAVMAVDPSPTMLEEAQSRHADANVVWLPDSLPALKEVHREVASFDAVLVSAVWMHLRPGKERQRAFRKIVGLLKANGLLYLSLRLGPADPSRSMFPVTTGEIENLARHHAMSIVHQETSADSLGRKDISWVTFLLQLPDDGTGALPLLRHVIVNDSKSSTYKLGLLRAVARIADSAQGMARYVSDKEVRIPLGLVALNWLRLYQPLLKADLPQSPQHCGMRGLGFVQREIWPTIEQMTATDLRAGMRFTGERAAALHQSLRAAANTIKNMPANYITYPGSNDPVFPVDRETAGRISGHLAIDEAYLRSFGELSVPAHLWRALSRFDVWIEPALISEWIQLMEGYAGTQERKLDAAEIARAMRWHDPERDVSLARRRVEQLMQSGKIHCIWSGQLLRDKFEIDHCLPWAVWPCGDLWNLFPSSRRMNQHKKDKLPSYNTMRQRSDRIMEWWDSAWTGNSIFADQFRTEAKASLPIAAPSPDLKEVFDGLQRRRFALHADHQVAEWSPG